MGFCYLPPERIKMCCCCLPPDRVKLTERKKQRNKETKKETKKQRVGSNWVKLGLAHFDSETIESNWAKRSQVGPGLSLARPILTRSQIGPRSQDG